MITHTVCKMQNKMDHYWLQNSPWFHLYFYLYLSTSLSHCPHIAPNTAFSYSHISSTNKLAKSGSSNLYPITLMWSSAAISCQTVTEGGGKTFPQSDQSGIYVLSLWCLKTSWHFQTFCFSTLQVLWLCFSCGEAPQQPIEVESCF